MADVVVKDWTAVAKSAGQYGIRYRTNAALEAFLSELGALSQAGAGGVDAGEPFGWVVGPVFFEEDPGALLGKRAVFVATPPAPVQTASVEELEAAVLYLASGCSPDRLRPDVKDVVERVKNRASLTAPTQGDGA